jgi:hypothetical protein
MRDGSAAVVLISLLVYGDQQDQPLRNCLPNPFSVCGIKLAAEAYVRTIGTWGETVSLRVFTLMAGMALACGTPPVIPFMLK